MLLLVSPFSWSSISLGPNTNHVIVGEQLRFFIDTSKQLDVNSVKGKPELFQPNTRAVYTGGYADGIHWLTFSLDLSQQVKELEPWLMEIAFPFLRKIDIYVFEKDTLIKHMKSGADYPFAERPYEHAYFVFPFDFKKTTGLDIYIRIDTSSTRMVPIEFWRPAAFNTHSSIQQTWFGMYYGVILALAFYNFFLYLTIKSKAYSIYTIYLVSLCLMQASLNGFASQYLWRESLEFSFIAPTILSYLTLSLALFFSRIFLDTQSIVPKLDLVLKAWGIGTGIYGMICYWLPPAFSLQLLTWVSTIWLGLIVTAAIICLIHGQRNARFFLLGWGLLLVAVMLKLGTLSGAVPVNIITHNALMFGSALEVILLALALADRINLMQEEKQQLQQEALEASQQSNRLKDEFLATISHELRTPMNGVEGALQLLKDEDLNTSAQSYVNSARYSAQDMMVLIDRVLDFSEIQSGKIQLNKIAFNLKEEITDIENKLKQGLKPKNLSLELKVNLKTHCHFYGDIAHLKMIVRNLLDNAIKFTPQGSICISISETAVHEKKGVSLIEIQVADTGMGIPPDKVDSIFEAFRQGDGSFSRQFGGLGIGLTINKRLVEMMQGTIHLESELGKGSCFTVRIPLQLDRNFLSPAEKLNVENTHREQHNDTNQYQENNSQEIKAPIKVLVVEDNPVNQMVLKGILKKAGVAVTTADNGAEALAKFAEINPDLILMDCQMPIKDGFMATREIRLLEKQQQKEKFTPIIAVTANAMSGDKERCLESGMNDYLKKPVDKGVILERLSYWLPQLRSTNSGQH
ncbi:MAG: ATP-binding protein [Pseudomonadales bacterium]|nr:ATP-binding protein [Pseudomonadales bacterium]